MRQEAFWGVAAAAAAGVLCGAAMKPDPLPGGVGGAQLQAAQMPARAPNAFDAWFPQEGAPMSWSSPAPVEMAAVDMAPVDREIERLLRYASEPLPVIAAADAAPPRYREPYRPAPYLPSEGGDILHPADRPYPEYDSPYPDYDRPYPDYDRPYPGYAGPPAPPDLHPAPMEMARYDEPYPGDIGIGIGDAAP